jgi:hypothetical protein
MIYNTSLNVVIRHILIFRPKKRIAHPRQLLASNALKFDVNDPVLGSRTHLRHAEWPPLRLFFSDVDKLSGPFNTELNQSRKA